MAQFPPSSGSTGTAPALSISTSTPQPLGTAVPGSIGKSSDAGHVHQMPSPAQINALGIPLPWDASLNIPTMVSSVAPTGDNAFVVTVPGSTLLDGISTWTLNDVAYYNGTTWQRIAASSLAATTAMLKGDGLGNAIAAIPGADYASPISQQSGVPVGNPPSGIFGSNGAFTMGIAGTQGNGTVTVKFSATTGTGVTANFYTDTTGATASGQLMGNAVDNGRIIVVNGIQFTITAFTNTNSCVGTITGTPAVISTYYNSWAITSGGNITVKFSAASGSGVTANFYTDATGTTTMSALVGSAAGDNGRVITIGTTQFTITAFTNTNSCVGTISGTALVAGTYYTNWSLCWPFFDTHNTASTGNGIWLQFPANVINGSNAAGFYWTLMSSTTQGTVYNNMYTLGTNTPITAIPSSPVSFVGVGTAYTPTVSGQRYAQVNFAAGAFGNNSALHSRLFIRASASGINKQIQNFFGPAASIGLNVSSGGTIYSASNTLWARGNPNYWVWNFSDYSGGSGGLSTSNINTTTTACPFGLTIATIGPSEWVILEAYTITHEQSV